MKKILAFLSIFAVLFVSTIRPLQAEVITDFFTLVNGNTYYFVYDSSITGFFTIAIADNGSTEAVIDLAEDHLFLEIEYGPTGGPYEYPTIPLTYVGEVEDYFGFDGNQINNAVVYSFVWSLPTTSGFYYDDSYFSLDTENPIDVSISIYDTIYSLINKFIFGNSIESGSHQDLTATILSTTICVLVFALPFLIIWKVIKIIMG